MKIMGIAIVATVVVDPTVMTLIRTMAPTTLPHITPEEGEVTVIVAAVATAMAAAAATATVAPRSAT